MRRRRHRAIARGAPLLPSIRAVRQAVVPKGGHAEMGQTERDGPHKAIVGHVQVFQAARAREAGGFKS